MSTTTQDAGEAGLVDQARSELGDVASDVQDKAVELKDRGREKLGETLDRRTTEVGAEARQAARVLRRTSTQMSGASEGSERVVHLTELAADQVERFGGYLERASGDELLRDAEDFARRRPWMVAGFGLVAGLAASRFLKASSERRYGSIAASGAGAGSPNSTRSSARAPQPVAVGVVTGR